MKNIYLLIILLFTGCGINIDEEVNAEPIQTNITESKKINIKDYTIDKKAEYEVTAIVLSKREYSDETADLIPIDIVLGWGKMSVQSNVDKLDISQYNRWYHYYYKEKIDPRDVSDYSANTHIIPMNDSILEKIEDVDVGEKIVLKGYLVNVSKNKEGRVLNLNSSLTRKDTGAGACEVFLVEKVS